MRVIGVNAGHAFSFIRDAALELRWAAAPAEGSQFRSRDLFPQAAAALVLGRPDALGGEINHTDSPDMPKAVIAYVDGYGNLKTTLRALDLLQATGTAVRVRVGGREHVRHRWRPARPYPAARRGGASCGVKMGLYG